GPDPHPGQARCVRPQPDRRDHRPLRAQGPADRRALAHDDDARAGRAALRRARGAPVLRRAGVLHHLRPAGGDGARGNRGRPRRASGHRRHQPARSGARVDPRRLRGRGGPEHGSRVRLARVGRARGQAVLRRPL
ncbi:MAG: Nucleoside diphosphate kinase, partial [uncultured Solirubrobacteraceae bacterium]